MATTRRLCKPNKNYNNKISNYNNNNNNKNNNKNKNHLSINNATTMGTKARRKTTKSSSATTTTTTTTTTTIRITRTTAIEKRIKLRIIDIVRNSNINSRSLVQFIIMLSVLMAASSATSISSSTSTSTRTKTSTSTATISQQQKNTLFSDEIENKMHMVNGDTTEPHIRKKRLIWITDDGRLALPPGTSLTITPTLALPFIRHPPEGFFSNMSISFPLTIDFDKLGLTDNQNPLGDFPPLFARSFGHVAGEMLGNYVARYLHYKRKRDVSDQNRISGTQSKFHIKHDKIPSRELPQMPELPERFKNIFHGGERVMLYVVVEDFLSTFGMDGKACLLRTICEIHSRNLEHYGVFGEMAKLFLTVTKSPFADLIPEYVQAQEIGEGRKAPGECYPYYKDCPKSIFKAIQNNNNKYSEEQNHEYHEADVEEVDAYSKLPLPDQRLDKLDNTDQSLNDIQDHNESLYVHSLSM